MRSLARTARSIGALVLALIASASVVAAGPQASAINQPPRGGRGTAPGRDVRPAPETPAGTASIVGTIVVSGTGAPARRARVTVSGEGLRGGRSVDTDDQGRYAFTALPAGRFTLSASKPGHLAVFYGQRIPGSGRAGTPIQLEDGQRLTIRLEIPRGGVISGTILDEHGDAVPGIQVRALRYSMQSGVRTLQPAGSDATDDRGIYRIYGLQRGDYLIGATPRPNGRPEGMVMERLQRALGSMPNQAAAAGATTFVNRFDAPPQDELTSGYAPVYFPGTTLSGNATSVTLSIGEERLGVDFQLQLVAMASVDGMVIDPAGQEAGGLQVQLVNLGEDVRASVGNGTRVDRDGTFHFANVAPGQYSLIARTGGPGGRGGPGQAGGAGSGPPGRGGGRATGAPRLWASTELTVEGRNLSNVVLTLQSGLSLSGRLDFRGSTAQPPADLTTMRVTLVPADMTPAGRLMAAAAPGRVDESGRFMIEGVTPGRYQLTGGGASGWSLESALVGGQETLDFPLDIRSSQNLTGAVVTFTDQQTTVSGTATNAQGQAVSDYTLIIYPADQRYWLPQSRRIRSIRPATDGSFSISGLPPGDYRAAPVLDPEPGSWFDATVLQQLDGLSERFSLAEGEKKVQNVRVGS